MAFLEIGNGWQSPRISFSVDLSQTDRTSPENRKRTDASDINYSTEFEFCSVNDVRDSNLSQTLMSADELFVDGKILPQIRAPEAQILSIARHLSVESSLCPSPVRSASYPPSKTSGTDKDRDVKSARGPSSRWKEMFMKDYFCAAVKEADRDAKESGNDVKTSPSGRSRWPFSRSGGERRGNSLLCALPFSRSKSEVERNCKPCSDASCYRSKSVGAESAFQVKESLLSASKPAGIKCEDFKSAAKGLPDLTKLKGSPGRALRSSPARNYGRDSPGRGNNRFMVQNTKTLDSRRRGRLMADGSVKRNYNTSGVMSMRVSPVLNVPALGLGSVGGRKNGRGLFGLRTLFSY